jgi:DNA-binding HxlR family transcriptional regulator
LVSSTVNGSGNGRSGAQILALLGTPLCCALLRALDRGPKPQAELRQLTGWPAQTTLRAQLKRLTAIGALERRRRNQFPGTVIYELTPPGRELLGILDVLQRWLSQAPGGPLYLGHGAAKAAINALAEGWSSGMLQVLASGPASLTQLDSLIAALSYPSLERRLAAMRLAGLTEVSSVDGRGTPHAVTEWMRRGVAHLLLVGRWESRQRVARGMALAPHELKAVFLLALPLLRLPVEHDGACRLTVEAPVEKELVSVAARVAGGTVSPCDPSMERPGAWILGKPAGWLDAIVDGDTAYLELGGDGALGRALLEGLYSALLSPGRGASVDASSTK